MGEPRNVLIVGSTARAIAPTGGLRIDRREDRSVKDLMDAAHELGREQDPNEQHYCPLCGDAMPWEPFARHAPACIRAYKAGRRHTFPVWAPNIEVSDYNQPLTIARW